ncbi:hypothetical protein ACHWQZ_G004648 [Mnemiopsis leidyi]
MSGKYAKLPCSDEQDQEETEETENVEEESLMDKIKTALSDGLKAAAEMTLDVASASSPFPYPTSIVPHLPADHGNHHHADQIK